MFGIDGCVNVWQHKNEEMHPNRFFPIHNYEGSKVKGDQLEKLGSA